MADQSQLTNTAPCLYIQVYVNDDNTMPKDIGSIDHNHHRHLKLVQIDAVGELSNLTVYVDRRKVPAWKAINNSAIKSYLEGIKIAIPCVRDDTDIYVDFTLGYCIRQGTIVIMRGADLLYSTVAVIPPKFMFKSGYDIVKTHTGEIKMITQGPSYIRGSAATLILWLGAGQAAPKVGTCNDDQYRFPIPITNFAMLMGVKVIDVSSRKNKYPTPINAHIKVIKAALESMKNGTIVQFKSIRADLEFLVDFSKSKTSLIGFLHIDDILNNITWEIRAQFPTNYIL
ncbi:hypothetical protein D5b_00039 [Faustovirus]|nr:hypothetical protein D5b_00039 [Faustovirus]AMN84870.1 hypothetical protein D6_00471 [Faustovirus]AMP43998.1 hypothetical protein PRJ_Dakar_00038 [Faustovirus]QKE50552.1 hypothetical protein F-VV10_0432 [Faustovirus]